MSGRRKTGDKEEDRHDHGASSTSARQRLEALVRTADGFVIAEEDLRIRGPGEFFGVRQWGMPEFRAANLVRDAAMLEQARQEAFALVKADPHLAQPSHEALRAAMLRKWQTKLDLGSVS
jgi:ATP-dependent DNA helicase RecG